MKKLIIVIGVLVVIVLGVVFFSNNDSVTPTDTVNNTEDPADPIDIVTEFYKRWLDAAKSTTTSLVDSGVINDPLLNDSVREYITSAQSNTEITLDPVLCQNTIPNRIGAKVSYILGTKAQLLILARGGEEKSSQMAVVDLDTVDGHWRIVKINCSSGETAPEREFSFEREGFLLKSVPPPLNPDYWHLVFEENGQNGHTAPLFFSGDSICIASDSTEAVCDESQFRDATKALVQGEMTEAGVNVKRVDFSIK